MAAERIVVTGASGFIGRALGRELADRGYEVVGLTRRAGAAPAGARPGAVAWASWDGRTAAGWGPSRTGPWPSSTWPGTTWPMAAGPRPRRSASSSAGPTPERPSSRPSGRPGRSRGSSSRPRRSGSTAPPATRPSTRIRPTGPGS
ncbi:MAG: NAD-dependent epimerase/dehydratase family protein [Candidatus Moduliflexus flocculans]|nr:NAD-dependent epimerase/dehydratase family protein [Candidatus Moduliflexus flocculans]